MAAKKKLDSHSRRAPFTYQESKFNRVIKVDGVWGGISPQAAIIMNVFSERVAPPDREEYEIQDDLSAKLVTASPRKPIVREVEAVLSLDPQVAKSLAKWLLGKVEELERLQAQEKGDEDVVN